MNQYPQNKQPKKSESAVEYSLVYFFFRKKFDDGNI